MPYIKFLLGMIVRVFDGDLSETQQEAFSKFRERNSRKFTLRPKTNQFQTTNSFTWVTRNKRSTLINSFGITDKNTDYNKFEIFIDDAKEKNQDLICEVNH